MSRHATADIEAVAGPGTAVEADLGAVAAAANSAAANSVAASFAEVALAAADHLHGRHRRSSWRRRRGGFQVLGGTGRCGTLHPCSRIW